MNKLRLWLNVVALTLALAVSTQASAGPFANICSFFARILGRKPPAAAVVETKPDGTPEVVVPTFPVPIRAVTETKTFKNGKPYVEFAMDPNVAASPNFREYVRSTVEVHYTDTAPFGHIRIRVGETIYSMNMLQNTSVNAYSPTRAAKGSVGAVFTLSAAQLEAIKPAVDALFVHSKEQNLPGFDAYSSLLQVVPQADGKLNFQSQSVGAGVDQKYVNNLPVNAKIVEGDNGRVWLETPDGYRFPAQRRAGAIYTQSLSCATAATYVMRDLLNMSVNFSFGAETLRDALLAGNPGGSTPDAVVRY